MDIRNNGPVLDAGNFGMRITNVGVIGNAFFNKGLSFDPSFEFPKGSGHECLEHAELWVGARREDGSFGVSGGPMLEWRAPLDSTAVVARRYAGDRGTRPTFDDDGDGKVDEEFLDGLDNDGDGEIDEDVRFPAQETAACTYTDDQPEAVGFGYENGEQHVPLGLTVEQEAHAWSFPGFNKVAGIHYTITNHGRETLRDVWLGMYANLDSRLRNDAGGHTNDLVTTLSDSFSVFDGISRIRYTGTPLLAKNCSSALGQAYPAVHDSHPESGLPWTAIVGLSHTTDPLNWLVNYAFPGAREAQAAARAPRRDTTFRYLVLAPSLPPGQGGPPIVDADRYAAMRGDFPAAPTDIPRDYSVLMSCGPFRVLAPGQSLEFEVAFVAAENADSLITATQSARIAYRGSRLNLVPDAPVPDWLQGQGGVNGHEICYTPPDGVVFNYDPNCTAKYYLDPAYRPLPTETLPGPSTVIEHPYRPGDACVWSDFDCDGCTGIDGRETVIPWFVQGAAPPQPSTRVTAGDREVTVEWDNLPELLVGVGVMPGAPFTFWGYRVYRLDDWRRDSLLPPTSRWQQVASFAADTSLGAAPLSQALNATVEYDSIAFERKHYPVGRYRFVDDQVRDGFDYHYVVTAVAQREVLVQGSRVTDLLESPFRAVFSSIVRARVEAGTESHGGNVWVVPNPFRASAQWERQPVPGDAFTRHVDFFGLPREHAHIKIFTLGGDLVQELDHDGTSGDGEAPWNLISRNGQDIESGVYLFTVDSSRGHQIGKFVIIR
jgi:hypothetical protein